jgi:hypothetical protein
MDEHGDHPEIRLERARRGKQSMVVLRMDALAEMDVCKRVDGGGLRLRWCSVAVAVATVVVHNEHAHNVQAEPDSADDHYLLWRVDGFNVDETLE